MAAFSSSLQPPSDLTPYMTSDGKPTKDFYNWLIKLAGAGPQLLGTYIAPTPGNPTSLYDQTIFKDNPTYNAFRFELDGLIPAADSHIGMLWASGGAWTTGPSINAQYSIFYNTATMNFSGSLWTGFGIPMAVDVFPASPGMSGVFTLYRPQVLGGKTLFGMAGYPWNGGGGNSVSYLSNGYWTGNAALDGFLVWTGGSVNLNSGQVRVYGIP